MRRASNPITVAGCVLTACTTWSPRSSDDAARIEPLAVRTPASVVELEPTLESFPDACRSMHIDGLGVARPRYGECVVRYAMGISTGFDALLGTLDLDGERSMYAARVPHGEAADRSTWRFARRDDHWSSDIDDAEPVFSGFDGVPSVFWSAPLQGFVALYGRIDRAGYALVARAAVEPVGPYGPPRVLTRMPWNAASIPSDVRVHADPGIAGGVEGERILISSFDPTIGARRVFRVTW